MTDPIRRNKERYNAEVAQIRNHPDYSAQAKRRYLGEAYAKAEHDRIVAEHKEEQQRNIADLEKKVFEVSFPLSVSPHEKETFRMSYRDAYDRAERAASGKEPRERREALTNLLERAERTGDGQQADAIYHLSVERGLFDVADTYRALDRRLRSAGRNTARPDRRQSLSEISSSAGWGRKSPPEIDGAPSPARAMRRFGEYRAAPHSRRRAWLAHREHGPLCYREGLHPNGRGLYQGQPPQLPRA